MNLALRRLTLCVGLFISGILSGCATYQSKVDGARNSIEAGQSGAAVESLKPLAEKEDGDQLVYLLDYATALQIAGDLKESNRIFLKADRLAEATDYHSLSRIAGSLALNEEMVQYKGDTFEKIFINAYLAMNFLELGQLDEALVEARRINEKYLKFRADEKKSFELNSFSKYLSAVIWEANKNYDDAYIAYSDAYKIDPNITTIRQDLIRSARLARRTDAYKEWKKSFPEVQEEDSWYDRNKGELIVVFQQGWGPRKRALPNEYRFPTLEPVYSRTKKARLQVVETNNVVLSQKIYDVERAAISTLRDDQGLLMAKRVAGIATKAVLSDQLRQKNEALGAIAWLALNVADRADVRQWSFLPQTIQSMRLHLSPGTYKFSVEGLGDDLLPTGEGIAGREVQIKAGQKKFVIWRSVK